jgi:hypothetical protein
MRSRSQGDDADATGTLPGCFRPASRPGPWSPQVKYSAEENYPNSSTSLTSPLFSRGLLIVAPGITIRDRLRVLLPEDPEN